MTPKEKALFLVDRFGNDIDYCEHHFQDQPSLCTHQAKQCALICCDEIIEALQPLLKTSAVMDVIDIVEYYKAAKNEIQNL